jgi:hypothetical protein
MKKLLLVLLAFLAIQNTAQSQAVLTFVDLDGFPDVVVDGQTYNLYGYITNTGNTASPAVLDIQMLVNNTTLVTITNNFSVPGGINPGDTVLWGENGFSFATANLNTNNNDIVIWPTGPTGGTSQSDSLIKTIYYSQQAGFRTTNNMVLYSETREPMEYSGSYPLTIKAVNLGKSTNTGQLKVYASANENGKAVEIGRITEAFAPGDTAVLNFMVPFIPREIGELSLAGLPQATVEYLQFWMQESQDVAPIQKGEVLVNDPFVGVDPEQAIPGIAIANHPVSSFLELKGLPANAQVQIVDLQGRVIRNWMPYQGNISVSTLAPSRYFLNVSVNNQSFTLPFTKQ